MNLQDILNLLLSFFNSGNTSNKEPSNVTVQEGTKLVVTRTHTDTFSTLGTLTLNNVFFCYTIELPKVSYNGSNICIPCGTFFISKYLSPHWGFEVPLLHDVPNRSEIEMHPANWAINPQTKKVYLLGCIAVGDKEDGTDSIDNSQDTFKKLMATIDWSKSVQITISE